MAEQVVVALVQSSSYQEAFCFWVDFRSWLSGQACLVRIGLLSTGSPPRLTNSPGWVAREVMNVCVLGIVDMAFFIVIKL